MFPVKNIGRQATATAIITGISKCSAEEDTLIPPGANIADKPSTARILKTLLPTTFPSAISDCPMIEDWMLTRSSGELVPKATIVRPIMSGDTPSLQQALKPREPKTRLPISIAQALQQTK
jgi:hypothetical protein